MSLLVGISSYIAYVVVCYGLIFFALYWMGRDEPRS